MMPCSTSCSRVLLCCRQSWRTVREQRHRGQGGNRHRAQPNPLSHLATICGFNHQTCQASRSTKGLLFPDQSATSKRPDGKPRHRLPTHVLHEYHKLYNSWTSMLERHWPRAVPARMNLSSGSLPEKNQPLMFNQNADRRSNSSDNRKSPKPKTFVLLR